MARPDRDDRATAALAEMVRRHLAASDHDAVARLLGATPSDHGGTVFACWVPHLADGPVDVDLELFAPPDGFDPSVHVQTVAFDRTRIPMTVVDEFAVVVATGVTAGTRDQVGHLYRFALTDEVGSEQHLLDPMASSTPYGAFAPAEVYDMEALDGRRADGDWFADPDGRLEPDGIRRFAHPASILQIHVPTAAADGTLAGLADRFRRLAGIVRSGDEPEPVDAAWLGFDAVQLMPVEPTVTFEAGPAMWEETDQGVRLRRPDTTDWGYDVVIAGSAAVNPALLRTGRPDELVDLAEALHDFPGGMKLIVDVVFGHADNQALRVMHPRWFTGPDMYGQHLDYRNPVVRAQLLEMLRRKASFGADGIRVDGAQDFTWWDPEREVLWWDDEFLQRMSDVTLEVAGHPYRPWMVFEDGRPWPKVDWELASTYRSVIDRQPDVFQWGPLTFAHNTPFVFTFWLQKWWRMREVADMGAEWISGCANHDTLRRGSQVDPEARVNTYLGGSLPEIIENGYDHGAATLLFHGFLPGVPMDFLQALTRTPWSFIRNTDHRYAVKVWGEEARFVDWRIPESAWNDGRFFERLRGVGFGSRDALHRFMHTLEKAVALHGDDLDRAVEMMAAARLPGPEPTREGLLAGARAWMDDLHEFCDAGLNPGRIDPDRAAFHLALRRFRQARRWLRDDLTGDDVLTYRHPADGAAVYAGLRRSPDGSEWVGILANMEGRTTEASLAELVDLPDVHWHAVLVDPRVLPADPDRPVSLPDGTGILYVGRTV